MKKTQLKPLSESFDWKTPFWITGYFKTYSTSALVSGMIGSLIAAIELNHPYLYLLSVILFVASSVQLYVIDKYGEKAKKKELDAIDERMVEYTEEFREECDENLLKVFKEEKEKILRNMEE